MAALVLTMAPVQSVPPAADPLTASIETADADRFAAIFNSTNGRPTAEQLQKEYLNPGSYGVRVFTPDRIIDAQHLATTVAKRSDFYARAVKTCLPIIKDTTAELRATYLAFHGLFPDRPLPRLYLVVGADNSAARQVPALKSWGSKRSADSQIRLRSSERSCGASMPTRRFTPFNPTQAGKRRAIVCYAVC